MQIHRCDVVGVLTWFRVDDNGQKIQQGSQSMSSAIEILGYSTEPVIQARYSNCFMIVCFDVEYHLGVFDKDVKDQWIVALMKSMEDAAADRFAYR